MRARQRQGGWVGLVVLLLAVCVVALLGKTLLRQMGLTSGTPGERAAAKPGNVDTEVVVPPPAAALERARGLEQAVKEQARENDARIDKVLSP